MNNCNDAITTFNSAFPSFTFESPNNSSRFKVSITFAGINTLLFEIVFAISFTGLNFVLNTLTMLSINSFAPFGLQSIKLA